MPDSQSFDSPRSQNYLHSRPPSANYPASASLQRSTHDSLRKRSLVRPERARSQRRGQNYEAIEENGHVTLRRSSRNTSNSLGREGPRTDTIMRRALGKNLNEGPPLSWWVILSRMLTCCCPGFLLAMCGKRDKQIQQAFREKLALCIIIVIMMFAVGFLTFGFQQVICGAPEKMVKIDEMSTLGVFSVRGKAYTIPNTHKSITVTANGTSTIYNTTNSQSLILGIAGYDLSRMFPLSRSASACSQFMTSDKNLVPCTGAGKTYCHQVGTTITHPLSLFQNRVVYTEWTNITNNTNYVVYSGHVWNISPWEVTKKNLAFFNDATFINLIEANRGKDISAQVVWKKYQTHANCMTELYKIADIDYESAGCVIAGVVLNISLVVIAGVVLVRFVLAVVFAFLMGWRLGERGKNERSAEQIKRRRTEWKNKNKKDARKNDNRYELNEISNDANPNASKRITNRFNMNSPVDGIHAGSNRDSNMPTALSGWRTPEDLHRNGSPTPNQNNYGQIQPTLPNVDIDYSSESGSRDYSNNIFFQDLSIPIPEIENDPVLNDHTLMHTLVMVPCYSEGIQSLRNTLDSVSNSYYPATHKCLFVIADGIVHGSGNAKPTSDILIDMLDVDDRFHKEDPRFGGQPQAYSYVAIADGAKRKNFARVYAGWYKYSDEVKPKNRRKTMLFDKLGSALPSFDDEGDDKGRRFGTLKAVRNRKGGRVPMLLIVKVGNEEERDPEHKASKPGNRGKRDSQVVLMNFLTKVMFDDRMTELEFDIFYKLWTITGVHPERYETVLFVDADTMVYPDSVTHMVAVMLSDPKIMGLCGETKIANKWGSWVSMIQVFEYYISHHLSKAFESVFGGVTCLPGCFSMLRIKAPKGGNGYYVPILANPDIVEEYSENVVDTLHKKNLLLLGEDRYLSTLMLRTFPKRKMIFVPLAICKTVVPDEFRVLLSQRRRWINSTIHNLLELLLVPDLCGTFCISMQFVIFMELVGTVVLPAAITFTIYVVVKSCIGQPEPTPLILLAAILGLPAVLIVLTASRLIYVFWMFLYLLSLPVWNFILPVYAFWNFDDFTWGETRKTLSDKKGEDHGKREGDFDGSGIHMRRWSEWLKERKREVEEEAEHQEEQRRQRLYQQQQQMYQSTPTIPALAIPQQNNRHSVFIAKQSPQPQYNQSPTMSLDNRKSMVVSSVPSGAQVFVTTRASIAPLSTEQLAQLQLQNQVAPPMPALPVNVSPQNLQQQIPIISAVRVANPNLSPNVKPVVLNASNIVHFSQSPQFRSQSPSRSPLQLPPKPPYQ
ncbi:Chitin synthase, class 3 [Nowakowskiella sp. JEL0078]|nr:Chitin synthase, class 3 [Nowakowskiella sp. JEL0078]